MANEKKWKRTKRKTVYASPFIELYEDSVELPNGASIDDYTVVKKQDIVLVVATNVNGEILVTKEYKYAVDEYLWTVPAGHIDTNELPLEAAKRELLEETGYTSNDLQVVGTLYEYPTKDMHIIYVVRATNIKLIDSPKHEDTEFVSETKFITRQQLEEDIQQGNWKTSSVLAGFLLSGVLEKR